MRTQLAVLLCAALALPAAAASDAGSNGKLFIDRDVAASAAARVTGSGIAFPGGIITAAASDAHGRSIVWREARRQNDEFGGTHVWYSQHLVGGGVDAEIAGHQIGVHYDKEDALTLVSGSQAVDLFVTNAPDVDAVTAAARAQHALRSAVRLRADAADVRGTVEELGRGARLIVLQDESAGDYRFVWSVPVMHAAKGRQIVYIDAQSERVIGIGEENRYNNCFPETTAHVTAYGTPLRDEIRNTGLLRNLAATPSTVRTGFTHEAFWSYGPYLSVYQETTDSTWACDVNTQRNTLVPITTVNGYPRYDNATVSGLSIRGRAAGDALHNTKNTMQAFAQMNRVSWDGAGASAGVVIESTLHGNDIGTFVPEPDTSIGEVRDPRIPPGKGHVAIGPSANYWSMAASLDTVAHEWGHGVIWSGPRFLVKSSGQVGVIARQLDEGYSDVIGNIVEKLRQNSGFGLERSSDWNMQEDVSGSDATTTWAYARGARDDGPGGHVWKGPWGYTPPATKDRLHVNDPDVSTYGYGQETAHSQGNMLVVVLRLLTEGGSNPICARVSTLSGCSGSANPVSVTALGFTKARQIMWNSIFRLFPEANWTDAANAAMETAYQSFKNCSVSPAYAATTEQQAVKDAFTAIGHPPSVAVKTTCN